MKLRLLNSATALLVLLVAATQARAAEKVDIKRAVPSDAYLAVYGKHNPERDYQRKYFEAALRTAHEEHIGQRVLDIITSRMPKEKLDKAREKWDQVKEAIEPVRGKAILDAQEVVFAELMHGPFNQYVVVCRLKSEDDAKGLEKAASQVFDLAVKWSDGKIKAEDKEAGDAQMKVLRLPKESPYHLAVAQVGDVILFASNPELAQQGLEQMQGDSGESKFDDARVKTALEHLPKPEDSLVFFDGAQLWKSLHGIGDFIRKQKPDDKDAERGAKILEDVISQIAILDYSVAVEYTEEGQNRTATYGKLSDNFEETLLGKALSQGEPFEDWEKWVPADAKSYMLCTGVNLHILYDGIINYVRDEFPESHKGLDKWAEVQEKAGVNLDEDILQNFSGEFVTVTLPGNEDSGAKGDQRVKAVKCNDPDRIRELLDRAVEGLNKLPAVKAQNLELKESDDLEGFQEIHANIFNAVGVQPVIGFKEGWMIVATHKEAAKKLVDVRWGDEDGLDAKKLMKKFDLKAEDPVYGVSYCDVGQGIRQAADALDKVGMMAPMFVGMAAAQGAKPEDMKPVQEAIGLLPSIAKVVRKFDFFEDRLKITYKGPEDKTFMQDSVTLIRQPTEKHSDDNGSDDGDN
jgi:hypothetical protein